MFKQKNLYFSSIIGFIFFIFIVGLDIVNFNNIYWLIDCPIICDAQQHILGWLFFKETNLLQFPLLKNTSFGLYTGSSLIYTDSLPILAIFFKFFNSILDFQFQYFGLWVLISFILQAIIAEKILRIYIDDNRFRLISIAFFCMSPIFLNKLFFSHLALASHWIILLTLYIYLSKKFKISHWILLISLSALVHGYYIGFTSIIFLMSLYHEYLLNKSFKDIIKPLSFFFTYTFLLLYSLGYFMIGGGFTNHGFGKFKMNLNALFDPKAEVTLSASRIFPELNTPSINQGFGDYEGFNFLGSGIIFLLILLIPVLIKNFRKIKVKFGKPKYKALIVFFGLIFLYSISNKIFIGNLELFSYDLPNFTKIITKTFRSSGRFFWIDYYLIYIFIFIIIYRYSFNYRYSLVSIFLIIQIYDMQPTFNQVRNVFYKDKDKYSEIYERNVALKDPKWTDLSMNYKRIIYVIPTRFPKDYFKLAFFAAENKMQTNFGYFSRVNKRNVEKENLKLLDELSRSNFDKESFYVFFHTEAWENASKDNPEKVMIIDGYKIIAP